MRGILPLRRARKSRAPPPRGVPNTTPPASAGTPTQERRGWKRKRRPRFWGRLRASNSARFFLFCGFSLFSLAEFADGCELGGERRQLGFYGGDFLLFLGGAPRFLGRLQRLGRLGFVEVVAADRGVGEHGHQLRLHFEDAARDEQQLLVPPP